MSIEIDDAFVCRMPQTEPMSAEELLEKLKEGHPNTTDWHHIPDKYTDIEIVAIITQRDALRDRDTLIKAAERVCDDCKTHEELAHDLCPYNCWRRHAILAPLAEGGKHGG